MKAPQVQSAKVRTVIGTRCMVWTTACNYNANTTSTTTKPVRASIAITGVCNAVIMQLGCISPCNFPDRSPYSLMQWYRSSMSWWQHVRALHAVAAFHLNCVDASSEICLCLKCFPCINWHWYCFCLATAIYCISITFQYWSYTSWIELM